MNRTFGLGQVVPLELASKQVEVVVAHGVQHRKGVGTYIDAQHVAGNNVKEHLRVKACYGASGFVDFDVDDRARAQNDGTG